LLRNLRRELPNFVRHLDEEMSLGGGIRIKNCSIVNCDVGVRLQGVHGALIDGLYTKNVRKSVLDIGGSRNRILNSYSEA